MKLEAGSYDPSKNGVNFLDLSRSAEKSTFVEVQDPGKGTWPEVISRVSPR